MTGSLDAGRGGVDKPVVSTSAVALVTKSAETETLAKGQKSNAEGYWHTWDPGCFLIR